MATNTTSTSTVSASAVKEFIRKDVNHVTISGILSQDIKVIERNGKKMGILDIYNHRKLSNGTNSYEHFNAIVGGKILENMQKCKIKKYDAITVEGPLKTSFKKQDDGSIKRYFSVQVLSFERSIMSANMTACNLTGRLVSRKSADGNDKANIVHMYDKEGKPTSDVDKANTMFFTIAMDYLVRNGETISKATQFVNCVAWGAMVSRIYKYTKCGYALHIVGRLNASDKRDANSKFITRYSRVIIDRFGILSRTKEENDAYRAKFSHNDTGTALVSAPAPASAPAPVSVPAYNADDVPFDYSVPAGAITDCDIPY